MSRNLIHPKLKSILADKKSGSSLLLKKINTLLKEQKDPSSVKKYILILKSHFKPFRNIQSYLNNLEPLLSNKNLRRKYFEEFEHRDEESVEIIYKRALPYLLNKNIILTLSNSGSVAKLLYKLSNKKRRLIIVSESRPMFEGRIFAKDIQKRGYNVEMITESMMADAVKRCGCILTGADKILRNKNAVNKMGSLQLAILAKHFKKPFYVIADKSKFDKSVRSVQSLQESNEIWPNRPGKIRIKNLYFEEVPKSLITKIFTDKKNPGSRRKRRLSGQL